jgi:iron complex transport system substrate-binding protein
LNKNFFKVASTICSCAILITGLAGCSQAAKTIQANILGENYDISINSSGEVLESFTATTSDGKFTINIPAKTIIKDKDGNRLTSFKILNDGDSLTPPQEGKEVITPAYTLQPDGATFSSPITITFNYDLAQYPDTKDDYLYSATYSSGTWTEQSDTNINTTKHTITVSLTEISSSTTYAVIGHTTRTITDMFDRQVTVPVSIDSVYCLDNHSTQLIYMLCPEKWIMSSAWAEGSYVPDIYTDNQVAATTRVNGKVNYEEVIKAKPDIALAVVMNSTTKESLDDTQTQLGGIPVVALCIGDYLTKWSEPIDFLESIMPDIKTQGDKLKAFADEAVSYVEKIQAQLGIVYYTTGDDGEFGVVDYSAMSAGDLAKLTRVLDAESNGLKTDLQGSKHLNLLTFCGGYSVAFDSTFTGLSSERQVDINAETIMNWNPESSPIDLIIIGRGSSINTYNTIMDTSSDNWWQILDCVKNGYVYTRPTNPTSWWDGPPGTGQLIGIYWMVHLLYPQLTTDLDSNSATSLESKVKYFYSNFWHYDLTDAELALLLSQPGTTNAYPGK